MTVTAEGFVAGRDPKSKAPFTLNREIDVKPVVLKKGQQEGVLILKIKKNAAFGTRSLVLRSMATIDGQKVTAYSDVIPLTIKSPKK